MYLSNNYICGALGHQPAMQKVMRLNPTSKICFISRERYPYYNLVANDQGRPEFIHDDNTRFTPEELVAQLLAKAKDFAEVSHGKSIY